MKYHLRTLSPRMDPSRRGRLSPRSARVQRGRRARCHPVFDLRGGSLRLGVIPGRAGVDLAVDHDIEVTGEAFPGTDRALAAVTEEMPVDAIRRKVVIPLHNDRVVGLGEGCAVPASSDVGTPPAAWLPCNKRLRASLNVPVERLGRQLECSPRPAAGQLHEDRARVDLNSSAHAPREKSGSIAGVLALAALPII